jgi:integrase
MKRKILTERFVRTVKANGKRTDWWCGRLPGFGILVLPSGHRTFVVNVRAPGSRTTSRFKIGTPHDMTVRQAREVARSILANPQSWFAERDARRGDRTVEDVGELWIANQRLAGRKGASHNERVLRLYVYPSLGGLALDAVRKRHAYDLHDALLGEGKSVATSHAAVTHLGMVLRFAVQRDMIDASPLVGIKLNTKPPARSRVLVRFHPDGRAPDAAELLGIWEACETLPARQAAFVRILILTGARVQEIADARWEEIDGSTLCIPAHRHKGGRGHDVPLTAQALAIINDLPQDGARVFGAIDPWAIKRQLPDGGWTFHDLRRTCATWMAEAGGFDTDTVHAVLGHAKTALARIYMTGSGYARKRTALEAWAKFLIDG